MDVNGRDLWLAEIAQTSIAFSYVLYCQKKKHIYTYN